MDKKLQTKRIIRILVLLLVVLVLGFFVYTWIDFNGGEVKYDQLSGHYSDTAKTAIITIRAGGLSVHSANGVTEYVFQSYSDNVLTVAAAKSETETFIVLDGGQTLFRSGQKRYYHKMEKQS